MDKYFYPAIFHKSEEGGYWITFPDFPECMTQGEMIEDSYRMAIEALGLCIDDRLKNKQDLPTATAPTDYTFDDGDFSCLIEFDLTEYRRRHNSKVVKKTLTIPEWLNEAACEKNINFSQVLKEALIAKLEV